jgi:hypothetical protein
VLRQGVFVIMSSAAIVVSHCVNPRYPSIRNFGKATLTTLYIIALRTVRTAVAQYNFYPLLSKHDVATVPNVPADAELLGETSPFMPLAQLAGTRAAAGVAMT